MKSSLSVASILLVMATGSLAWADDDEAKLAPGTISVVIPAELQSDWTVRTSPGGGDRVNLWTKIEPEITFQATEELSFLLGVTLEQVRVPDRGEDEAFESHGLYVKTLTANYDGDDFGLFGGKFTPNFGRAWDSAPGIYGDRFAKDYEYAERWGLGGSVDVDETPLGDLTFSASVFMVDRTALSDSVITRRGRTTRADGGPGNTDSPNSFAVAIDGANPPLLETWEYHLAYTHQAKGDGDTGSLNGLVASTQVTVPIVGELDATPLLEWASFENYGGVRDADRTVWTAALQLTHGPWQWVAAYARRDLSGPDGVDEADHSLQLSTGFTFGNGLLAELGWWRVEEAGETSDIIGARLSYELGAQFRLY